MRVVAGDLSPLLSNSPTAASRQVREIEKCIIHPKRNIAILLVGLH